MPPWLNEEDKNISLSSESRAPFSTLFSSLALCSFLAYKGAGIKVPGRPMHLNFTDNDSQFMTFFNFFLLFSSVRTRRIFWFVSRRKARSWEDRVKTRGYDTPFTHEKYSWYIYTYVYVHTTERNNGGRRRCSMVVGPQRPRQKTIKLFYGVLGGWGGVGGRFHTAPLFILLPWGRGAAKAPTHLRTGDLIPLRMALPSFRCGRKKKKIVRSGRAVNAPGVDCAEELQELVNGYVLQGRLANCTLAPDASEFFE